MMAPSGNLTQYVSGPLGVALVGLGVLLGLLLLIEQFFAVKVPKGMPLLWERPGATRFSIRTRLAYYWNCEGLFRSAWENYSKKGKAVVIPGLGFRVEYILPHNQLPWVFAQPESTLSLTQAFVEVDQVQYSLGHDRYVVDPWQGMLVKKEMNAVLENITAGLNDELAYAFDTRLGTATAEWKEIDLLDTMRLVVAQGASRFTVGLPLCRNEEYLRNCLAITDGCIYTAGFAGAAPKVLRPLVGRLVSFHLGAKLTALKKQWAPLYRERLELMKHPVDDPQHLEPQDHLQMMFRYAHANRPDELHDFDIMTKRLCTANFGSMHQTSIQVTNMLLNIIGSDAEYNTMAVLREEVTRVLYTDGDPTWTKTKVAKMVKADSVARETLRLHSFGGRAIFRKVLVDGVKTEEGYELPRGVTLSLLSQPAHTDPEKYEDALRYDPFRFSRVRECAVSGEVKGPNVSFVTTSLDHLPFGHGKHACPGRWLVDFELKMIIAYLLTHYEVEFPDSLHGKRPPNMWVTEALFPPSGVKVRVRRRTDSI